MVPLSTPRDCGPGCCPGCDLPGVVAEPCDRPACRARGLHVVPATWASDLDPHRDPRLGLRVDDFLLVALLGVGGFGRVYLALQLPLGMLVAVKIADADVGRSTRGRGAPPLEREALALARLTHPNVVRLLRHGVWETVGPRGDDLDLPYLVTEYIPGGRSLEGTLMGRTTGAIPREWAATVLRQLLDGLAASHAAGVVHRDVKPDNIMLQAVATDGLEAEGAPLVRLLDFGLARLDPARANAPLGFDDPDDVGPEDPSEVGMGTPTHMAPEQIHGGPIGPWTDLYAAGVIAFELLVGFPPFDGDSVEEVMRLRDDLLFDPVALAPRLPEPCERFLRRAMAFEAEDRFQSAAEMRVALDAALAGWPEATDDARKAVIRATITRPTRAPRPAGPTAATSVSAPGGASRSLRLATAPSPGRVSAAALAAIEDAWYGEAGPDEVAATPAGDDAGGWDAWEDDAVDVGADALAGDGWPSEAGEGEVIALTRRRRRRRLGYGAVAAAALFALVGFASAGGADGPPRPRAEIEAAALPTASPPAAASAAPEGAAPDEAEAEVAEVVAADAEALALVARARRCELTGGDLEALASVCTVERGCAVVESAGDLDRWTAVDAPASLGRAPVASVVLAFAPQAYDDARRCGARWRRGAAIVEGAWDEIPASYGGYLRPRVAVEVRPARLARGEEPPRHELTVEASRREALMDVQQALAGGATSCFASDELGGPRPFPLSVRAVEEVSFHGVGIGFTGERGLSPCRLDLARVYVLNAPPDTVHTGGPATAKGTVATR